MVSLCSASTALSGSLQQGLRVGLPVCSCAALLAQVWRDVRVQLQEEAGGGSCLSIQRLMEEGGGAEGGVAAASQLQPRPAVVQMMALMLQLAHAVAAAGMLQPPFYTYCAASQRCGFSAVTRTLGVSFNDVIVPLTQDAVRCSQRVSVLS